MSAPIPCEKRHMDALPPSGDSTADFNDMPTEEEWEDGVERHLLTVNAAVVQRNNTAEVVKPGSVAVETTDDHIAGKILVAKVEALLKSTGDPFVAGGTADDTIVADGALPAAPRQPGVALPRRTPSSPTPTVGRVGGLPQEDEELPESSTAAQGDKSRHNTARSSFEIMGCVSALPAAGGPLRWAPCQRSAVSPTSRSRQPPAQSTRLQREPHPVLYRPGWLLLPLQSQLSSHLRLWEILVVEGIDQFGHCGCGIIPHRHGGLPERIPRIPQGAS